MALIVMLLFVHCAALQRAGLRTADEDAVRAQAAQRRRTSHEDKLRHAWMGLGVAFASGFVTLAVTAGVAAATHHTSDQPYTTILGVEGAAQGGVAIAAITTWIVGAISSMSRR